MHPRPLVSIITINLNGVQYLEECIKSCLSQDYPLIEHIIVDGGSRDGSVELLKKYHDLYPGRIKFISEPDQGPGDAWNKGIKMSQGDILGWLGADDFYEKNAINSVLDFFNSNPNACFVYGGVNIVDAKGQLIKTTKPRVVTLDYLINERQVIITPAAFYRKEIFATVGQFDNLGNDVEFFIRIAKRFPMHTIGQTIVNFRLHDQSQTKGADCARRRMWLREWYLTSRRHGGKRFSGYWRRYVLFSMFSPLLPVWNYFFLVVTKMQGKHDRERASMTDHARTPNEEHVDITVIRHSIRDRGGDRLVLDYLAYFLDQGHRVTYWTNEVSTAFPVDPRIQVKKIPLPGVAGTIVFTLLTKFPSKIILVDLVVMAYFATTRNRGRILYLAQDHDVTYYKSPLLKKITDFVYARVLCKLAVPTVSVSAGLTSRLENYQPKNLTTIPNGVDLTFFHRDQNSNFISKRSKTHVILLFARGDHRKGLDIALNAIEKLLAIRQARDWEIWTIGPEVINVAEVPVRNFGFLGSDEQLRAILSAADIYMVPSRSEGLSLLLLQALACQCAVVSTAASTILSDGVDGLVSPVEDPAALAENLNRVMDQPELKERLKTAARALAQRYSWAKSCESFERVVRTF